MKPINLRDLRQWINDEMAKGDRVKASKLYKVFCKYAKIKFPKVTEEQLENFNNYKWDY